MKTQNDIVAARAGLKNKYEVRQVVVPGIESLHTKPTSEIAEVLAIVLKSQKNIIAINYKVGDCIELTYEP